MCSAADLHQRTLGTRGLGLLSRNLDCFLTVYDVLMLVIS